MINVAERMLDAMTGPGYGPRAAWNFAVVVYVYTRSHDGDVISDDGDTISFSRWYCFCCAVESFWTHLYKRP